MTNPRCCRRKISVFRLISISSKEWPFISMSANSIIILMFILPKSSLAFLTIFLMFGKGKGTRTSFLTIGSKQLALNFFSRELKNMRLLSLACACNLLFATWISDFANPPFWSGKMGYRHTVVSNLSLVFGPYPSFLEGISFVQTPFLMDKLLWWLPSLTFLLPPFSPILPLLDSLLVGKGFLTEEVLNERKFCILLQCPKSWDPVLFSSRVLRNISIFQLMERQGYFLTRIIFFSMAQFS